MSGNQAPASAAGDASPSRGSCLVIEDDPSIVLALAFTLRRHGLECVASLDANCLEATLVTHRPRAVFLDLSLRGYSEGSAARQILSRLAACGFGGDVQLMSGRGPAALDEATAIGQRLGLTMLPPLAKPFRMGLIAATAARLGRQLAPATQP
jgi:DNA-binding NtrC family response regulator